MPDLLVLVQQESATAQEEKDSFVWKMFLNEVQNRQKQVLEVSVKKREEEWRRQTTCS